MPLTFSEIPILIRFLCTVEKTTGMPAQPLDATAEQKAAEAERHGNADGKKPLPKGVVLGPDGKPCRTCTSVSSWLAMTKQQNPSSSSSQASSSTIPVQSQSISPAYPSDCPPDVELLGRSAWTLLHSITATYPPAPSPQLQRETTSFLHTFSKLYPCWHCAEDFQRYLKEDRNAPRVSSREEFGRWMCEAHNAVNVKLGKESFDCNRWEERWRTGWKDGRCG